MARIVEETLARWYGTRENVIAEVRNIPADSFDFRPHPGSRSVGELALHIAASGLVFAGEIAREKGDLWRQSQPAFYREYAGHLPPSATREEALRHLDVSRADALEQVRRLPPEQLLAPMRAIGGLPESRLSVLEFCIAHEFYHCGQLTVYARSLGVVPAMTQKAASAQPAV